MSTSTSPVYSPFFLNYLIHDNETIDLIIRNDTIKTFRQELYPVFNFINKLCKDHRILLDNKLKEKYFDYFHELKNMRCKVCSETFFLSILEYASSEIRDLAFQKIKEFSLLGKYDSDDEDESMLQNINEMEHEFQAEEFDKFNELVNFVRALETRFDYKEQISPYYRVTYPMFRVIKGDQDEGAIFVNYPTKQGACKDDIALIVYKLTKALFSHRCAAAYIEPKATTFTTFCGSDGIYYEHEYIPHEFHLQPLPWVTRKSVMLEYFTKMVTSQVIEYCDMTHINDHLFSRNYTPIIKMVVLAAFCVLIDLMKGGNPYKEVSKGEFTTIIYDDKGFNYVYLNRIAKLNTYISKDDNFNLLNMSHKMLKVVNYIQLNTFDGQSDRIVDYNDITTSTPTMLFKVRDLIPLEEFKTVYLRNFNRDSHLIHKYAGSGKSISGMEVRVFGRSKFTVYSQLYLRGVTKEFNISRCFSDRKEIGGMDFRKAYQALSSMPTTQYQSINFLNVFHKLNYDKSTDTELEAEFIEDLAYLQKENIKHEKGKILTDVEAYKLMRNAIILPLDTTGDGYDKNLEFYEYMLGFLHKHVFNKKNTTNATEEIRKK